MVIGNVLSDYSTIYIAPILFDTNKEDMLRLVRERTDAAYLLRMFLLNLPLCFIVAFIVRWFSQKKMK